MIPHAIWRENVHELIFHIAIIPSLRYLGYISARIIVDNIRVCIACSVPCLDAVRLCFLERHRMVRAVIALVTNGSVNCLLAISVRALPRFKRKEVLMERRHHRLQPAIFRTILANDRQQALHIVLMLIQTKKREICPISRMIEGV
ncbi:hypothetical protein D3C77_484330 [compost metagenome]